uniref:Transposase of IS4/5 family (DUF4096) n=1 Tax=Candidatus Kentrum sp. FW TaxID=2126338 RepID=A0A450TMN8_9GAMM|nr:MAG: Putative transposase of IS4/5 family (DUF4096) [Candidatus Kentron sp. FW]
MSELFQLTKTQLRKIELYFPVSRDVPRVDDLRVISGIIHVLKRGLQWRDAPKEYGPYKTLYNRFIRWSCKGVFEEIFIALAAQEDSPDQL